MFFKKIFNFFPLPKNCPRFYTVRVACLEDLNYSSRYRLCLSPLATTNHLNSPLSSLLSAPTTFSRRISAVSVCVQCPGSSSSVRISQHLQVCVDCPPVQCSSVFLSVPRVPCSIVRESGELMVVLLAPVAPGISQFCPGSQPGQWSVWALLTLTNSWRHSHIPHINNSQTMGPHHLLSF